MDTEILPAIKDREGKMSDIDENIFRCIVAAWMIIKTSMRIRTGLRPEKRSPMPAV